MFCYKQNKYAPKAMMWRYTGLGFWNSTSCVLFCFTCNLLVTSFIFTHIYRFVWPYLAWFFKSVWHLEWPKAASNCRYLLLWKKNQASQTGSKINYALAVFFQPTEHAWFSETLLILSVVAHLQWNRKPGYPDRQFCGGDCWGHVPHAGTAPAQPTAVEHVPQGFA